MWKGISIMKNEIITHDKSDVKMFLNFLFTFTIFTIESLFWSKDHLQINGINLQNFP